MAMTRRPQLRRSRTHRILGGVCGGLAEWLGRSPGLIRFLYVLVSVFSAAFPGIVVYLILWLVIPEEPLDPNNPIASHTGRNLFLAILIVLLVVLLPTLGLIAIRAERSPGP